MAPQIREAESLQFGDVQSIAIELIIREPALQPRADISEAVVDKYARDLEAGAEFPPVLLVRVDQDVYEVADGNTTIAAAEKLGHAVVNAKVATGEPGVALEYGHTLANRTHGQPLSDADTRKRFDWLELREPYKSLNATKMADLLGVHRTTVSRWRRGESDATPPSGGACNARSHQAPVLRIWNGQGKDQRPAWIAKLAEPYEKAIADLDKILAEVEEHAADPVKGGYLRLQIARMRRMVNELIALLRGVEPVAICPSCSGEKCGECRQTGFLSRAEFEKRAAAG